MADYTINLRNGKVYRYFKSIGQAMAMFRTLEKAVDCWPDDTTIRKGGKVLATVSNGVLKVA